MVEGVGDGAGGSHHGTCRIGLSCCRRLLQMHAHVDVQDRTMLVSQVRLRLRGLLMSGAGCQRCAPDPTGRAADNAGSNYRRDGDGEAKEAERAQEGREDTDASGEQGEGERTGRRNANIPTTNDDQRR